MNSRQVLSLLVHTFIAHSVIWIIVEDSDRGILDALNDPNNKAEADM